MPAIYSYCITRYDSLNMKWELYTPAADYTAGLACVLNSAGF